VVAVISVAAISVAVTSVVVILAALILVALTLDISAGTLATLDILRVMLVTLLAAVRGSPVVTPGGSPVATPDALLAGALGRFAGSHAGRFARNGFGHRGRWDRFARLGRFGGGRLAGGWGGGWGGWGGWVGPVFWPFLWGDIFSYALWPYEDYPFWSYGTAYDYAYEPYEPAYGYSGLSNIYGYTGTNHGGSAGQIPAEVTQSCSGFAPGVTSFPIERIRTAIHPTGEQVSAIDNLADASSRANSILSASCPSEPPLTPLARLDAVEKRFEAMIQAIQIVLPSLAEFYDSLSGEQRRRLDEIGRQQSGSQQATVPADTITSLCDQQAASFTKLPEEAIEKLIKPTGDEQTALDELQQVSTTAADELRGSCPVDMASTPVERLDQMSGRLQAMTQAITTVRPKLEAFYGSLNDEQKAQLNAMGQQNRIGGRQG
jgi:hypothetical protein